MLDDLDVPAALGLLRAQSGDDAGAGLVGPVGARLDHPAGGDRADRDVGPKHQQLVVALGRSELNVGILPRLDAAAQGGAERQRERQSHFPHNGILQPALTPRPIPGFSVPLRA